MANTMPEFEVELMRDGEAAACEAILRELPDWFGIEESIVDYRKDIESMTTAVARRAGGILGFVTIRNHYPTAGEIQVIAVTPDHRGLGVGRALVAWAERTLRATGTEYLQVKTLGPSRPCAAYEQTRRFYEAVGFHPLEETSLWGERNPCLIMVKAIG